MQNLQPEIRILKETKLVGQHLDMCFGNNLTGKLWAGFMPRRKEITNAIGEELYSVQLYDNIDFANLDPTAEFTKWAAVEVPDFTHVPDGMDTLTIPSGQYAVFHYKGLAGDPAIFQYIFGVWLPQSAYQLDKRPHFEVLGEKYRNNDPNSEEEIWVPITNK